MENLPRSATQMPMLLDLNDIERTSRVHHALSTPLRLSILRLLSGKNYYVNEIAELLGIPSSTAALNVRILEEAGLIITNHVPGTRGVAKICSRMVEYVSTDLRHDVSLFDSQVNYSQPIGGYCDCDPGGEFSGILSQTGPIGRVNHPTSFYEPDRIHAQLIWFRYGYLEYRISNRPLKNARLNMLRLSFEACSEVPNSNPDWPSDIFVSVNGIELGIWTSPGDFGERRGLLTPEWWGSPSTQYGLLTTWEVTRHGTLLNDKPLSGVCINDLNLGEGNYFTLRIGVHRNARNMGGINLFGSKFGDHPQDILLQVSLNR